MIGKDDIAGIIEDYDRLKLRVGMTASHSALDICDGAIEEGFPTVAYCQKGREKTYSQYFKTQRTVSGRVRRGMNKLSNSTRCRRNERGRIGSIFKVGHIESSGQENKR